MTHMGLHLDLEIGSIFANRYQILEELGSGGMGKVYKVMDREVKEKIAIKIIRPEISIDTKIIERFRNELKLARKITHPNICRMYDLNKDKGLYFLTMEYVSGEDLKSTLTRVGQLSVGKTLAVAREICKGLAEAHKTGIVHRDLKPHNIIIDRAGDVRIMDFGIAHSLKTKGMTDTGVLIGTPEYISPEQVVGQEADQRTDIYALGVILFECLTGRVPFRSDSVLGLAFMHKTETPPNPKSLNPQIPEDVNEMVLRCLEKDRENRYQTAGQVLEHIDRILQGRPTTEKVLPAKPSTASRLIGIPGRRLGRTLLISTLVAVGVLASYLLYQQLRTHPATPAPPDGWEIDAKPTPASLVEESGSGHIDIGSLPPGATVFLDGKDMGTTPTGRIDVPPGRHHLRLVLSGHNEIETDIEVEQGGIFSREYTLDRTPARAAAPAYTVRVESEPPVADIYVNGVYRAKTPGAVTSDSSAVELRVVKNLYEPWSGTVNLKSGPNDPVKVYLKRRQFKISLQTEPQGADVFLDGSPIGQAPLTISVDAGSHKLRFDSEGYAPWEESLNITENGTIRRTLKKIDTVSVEFVPMQDFADIYLSGRMISRAADQEKSIRRSVPIGEHKIEFRSGTYGSVVEVAKFEAGKSYRIVCIFTDGKINIFEDPVQKDGEKTVRTSSSAGPNPERAHKEG